ncbi:alpha/beta hydrolase [Aureliella helgolandensis]|nr:PHB depolymerase family esterase [Aureliella helgolandensis]
MRNRLCSSEELVGRIEKLQSSNPVCQLEDPSYLEHQICLFGPERYEPRYEYPLVVWLHSCSSGERELENVMPALSLQNYVACAPRGTVACDPEGKLFRWGSSNASTAIAEEIVFDTIEMACSQFSVAKERIFLAGFGGGGSMAWQIALRYPKRFAGVVSICGQFPQEHRPLSNYENARDLPSLWLYGNESNTCGIQQVCESLPVMHAASLAVDIRQYPCGNELLSNMLSDTNSWLMERVTSQPAAVEQCAEESFSRN